MRTVTVRLFARARDLAGTGALLLDLADDATVADLRRRVTEVCPALVSLVPRCAVAVDGEFAEDTLQFPAAAEVAVLPPVSGG